MRRVVVAAVAVVLVATAGSCFSPSFVECNIACGADPDHACPSGWSCAADGFCHAAGDTSLCGDPLPDGAVHDGASIDAAAPDAMPTQCGDGVRELGEICFRRGDELPLGGAGAHVALLDYDGDDDLDVAVARIATEVRVFTNETNGVLVMSGFLAVDGPTAVAGADLDGDGRDELAVTDDGVPGFSSYSWNGAAFIMTPHDLGFVPFLVASAPLGGGRDGVALAGSALFSLVDVVGSIDVVHPHLASGDIGGILYRDLDANGLADVVVSMPQVDGFEVSLGVAGNDVGPGASYAGAGAQPAAIATGDFDDDGVADLVALDGAGTGVSAFLASEPALFAPRIASALDGSGARDLVVVDLDGDDLDEVAVVLHDSNAVAILKSDGTGLFTTVRTLAPIPAPVAIAAGDLDDDGGMDLVIANEGDSTAALFYSDF